MTYRLDTHKIEALLSRRGLSGLSELARKANVHRNTLGYYVKGRKGAFAEPIERIAEVLGVDPIYLIAPGKVSAENDAAILQARVALAPLFQRNLDLSWCLLGSRAKGKQKKYSDIDLGITGGSRRISSARYLQLKSEMEDLVEDLGLNVDLVNLDQAPQWFLRRIDYLPVLIEGDSEAFAYFLGVINGIQRSTESV